MHVMIPRNLVVSERMTRINEQSEERRSHIGTLQSLEQALTFTKMRSAGIQGS